LLLLLLEGGEVGRWGGEVRKELFI